jgi:subtilase family serine protease
MTVAAACAILGTSWGTAGAVPVKSERSTVDGSHPAWAVPAARVGGVDANTGIVVRVYLRGRDDAGLEAVARAVSTPKDALYHHFLTPADVRARFAPTNTTVAAVSNWLAANGLQVLDVPANNVYVEASGSASQIESTFGTDVGTYQVHGRQLRAPDRALTVPSSLAGAISGVVGVDESEALLQPDQITVDPNDPKTPGFRNATPCSAYWSEKLDTTDPAYDGGFPSPLPYAPCGYTPPQMRSAYGVGPFVDAGKNGASATVAIIGAFASPTIFQDASNYAIRNDPNHPLSPSQFSQLVFKPNQKVANAKYCDAASNWFSEESLDVEAVHAMAPGAHILYVGAADCSDFAFDVATNAVVANHLAQIISNSTGDLGEDLPADVVNAFEQIAIQAAAEGIGVYFASGDDGDGVAAIGHAAVSFPASSPWVTAVGGTSLGIAADGTAALQTGWETGKSVLSASGYAPVAPGSFVYGSGGGTSTLFGEPDYQKGVVPDGLANADAAFPGRVVPDIAMDGDVTTGFLVGQTQQFSGPGGVQYSEYRSGGTSLSAPLFAGVMALADDAAGSPHGFINPSLYELSGSSSITDVTHADAAAVRVDYVNGIDARRGTITSVRTMDFGGLTISTEAGYDNTTGLGVPNGEQFLHHI